MLVSWSMARCGTSEGDESELQRIDPGTGAVLERMETPAGVRISGPESDGEDRFDCGGGHDLKRHRAWSYPIRHSWTLDGSTAVDIVGP